MTLTLWVNVPLDQRGEPWMTRRRHPRLWLTDDGRELVTDGDPRAAALLIGENEPPPYEHRIRFYNWLAEHQPSMVTGCQAAVRDRHGLYRPCRIEPKGERAFCRSHDPDLIAASMRVRAAKRALHFQWCNWVGEGVPVP